MPQVIRTPRQRGPDLYGREGGLSGVAPRFAVRVAWNGLSECRHVPTARAAPGDEQPAIWTGPVFGDVIVKQGTERRWRGHQPRRRLSPVLEAAPLHRTLLIAPAASDRDDRAGEVEDAPPALGFGPFVLVFAQVQHFLWSKSGVVHAAKERLKLRHAVSDGSEQRPCLRRVDHCLAIDLVVSLRSDPAHQRERVNVQKPQLDGVLESAGEDRSLAGDRAGGSRPAIRRSKRDCVESLSHQRRIGKGRQIDRSRLKPPDRGRQFGRRVTGIAASLVERPAVESRPDRLVGRCSPIRRQQGGLPVAVVSNNSAGAVTAYLLAHRLASYISPIVGRAYADPARMKPNPEPVRQAVTDLGIQPSRAALVGDSLSDIEAGRAAGVRTIGYANRPAKVTAFRDAGADVVIESMGPIAEGLSRDPGD
jgi:Haloacid dehalogenase-like hydrolase